MKLILDWDYEHDTRFFDQPEEQAEEKGSTSLRPPQEAVQVNTAYAALLIQYSLNKLISFIQYGSRKITRQRDEEVNTIVCRPYLLHFTFTRFIQALTFDEQHTLASDSVEK